MANSHRLSHFLPPNRRQNPHRRRQNPLYPTHHLPIHHSSTAINLHPPRFFHHLLPRMALQLQASSLLFRSRPLSSTPPLSLLHFICIGVFPIKTIQNPSPKSNSNPKSHSKAAIFALKCLLLAIVVYLYKFREILHPNIILLLYCCHIYLGVELILAITALPVRVILGLELEPQFDEPYLATSLQDFWGRRWNIMVTSILRPTVYLPVRLTCGRFSGGNWARTAAILATFLVSGLMHELIYYYWIRDSPSWEVTCFFVLHGFCVAVEVAMKKVLAGRLRLHKTVSRLLTVGFVAVTGGWLFFPQIIRHGVDRKAIDEYTVLVPLIRQRLL